MIVLLILDATMGGLKWLKKCIRIIIVATYEVYQDTNFDGKWNSKKHPKSIKIDHSETIEVDFEIWGCLGTRLLLTVFGVSNYKKENLQI